MATKEQIVCIEIPDAPNPRSWFLYMNATVTMEGGGMFLIDTELARCLVDTLGFEPEEPKP